jgi:histidinol-phosphate aminotransferase
MTYSSARDEFKDFDVAQMIFLDANENPSKWVNRYPDHNKAVLKLF